MANQENTANTEDYPRASFMRRLAAMVYDGLVAVAIGLLAGLVISILLMVAHSNGLIGQEYEHFMDYSQNNMWVQATINTWVLIWVIGFFMWFWVKGGQTIGMRAWRLRLFSTIDEPVTMLRLWVRLLTSLMGLGTLLCLFDREQKLALQDRASQTEMLVLTKQANDHKNW